MTLFQSSPGVKIVLLGHFWRSWLELDVRLLRFGVRGHEVRCLRLRRPSGGKPSRTGTQRVSVWAFFTLDALDNRLWAEDFAKHLKDHATMYPSIPPTRSGRVRATHPLPPQAKLYVLTAKERGGGSRAPPHEQDYTAKIERGEAGEERSRQRNTRIGLSPFHSPFLSRTPSSMAEGPTHAEHGPDAMPCFPTP